MHSKSFALSSLLLFWFVNLAQSQFNNPKTFFLGANLNTPLVEVDVNHDGKQDTVGLGSASGVANVTALLGSGAGGFQPTAIKSSMNGGTINTTPSKVGHFAMGVFTSSGDEDAVFLGFDNVTNAPVAVLMLGNGDGTFKPPKEVAMIPSFTLRSLPATSRAMARRISRSSIALKCFCCRATVTVPLAQPSSQCLKPEDLVSLHSASRKQISTLMENSI